MLSSTISLNSRSDLNKEHAPEIGIDDTSSTLPSIQRTTISRDRKIRIGTACSSQGAKDSIVLRLTFGAGNLLSNASIIA